jgi:hypothetical protein
MPIFTKDPEKEAQKQRDAEAKARAAEEAAFWASPVGRARKAREQGQRIFEISWPITQTGRTVAGILSGDKATKRSVTDANDTVLEQIEAEGWRLEHAGYVFEQTGSVSRDKLLSTGQTAAVTGQIVGIYLFRSTDNGGRGGP